MLAIVLDTSVRAAVQQHTCWAILVHISKQPGMAITASKPVSLPRKQQLLEPTLAMRAALHSPVCSAAARSSGGSGWAGNSCFHAWQPITGADI
jgi:hypothetical protein